jgi:hypothetical protein
MKYKNLEVAKSLRLHRADADWLSRVASENRLPESEVLRLALQAMRGSYEKSGGFMQDNFAELKG